MSDKLDRLIKAQRVLEVGIYEMQVRPNADWKLRLLTESIFLRSVLLRSISWSVS